MSGSCEAMLVVRSVELSGLLIAGAVECDGVWRSRIIVLVAAPSLGLSTRSARDLESAAGNCREQPHPRTNLEELLTFL
jgi:hypothetical protein